VTETVLAAGGAGESVGTPWLWGGFTAFILALLALDLGVFQRRGHAVRAREALVWSAVWAALALSFAGVVWVAFGAERAEQYLAGWLIEKSLSVDNLFVFVVIFGAFRIPPREQHRVLFWGILSALVLRAAMIIGGAALLQRFHWLVYVFGVFLVVTGLRLWRHRKEAPDAGAGPMTRWVRRLIPSTPELSGGRFVVREGGRRLATPLLLSLVAVELTDVAFAVDSIPAIFAVTTDPFIVYTSNVFAILGLRSLYFLLADMVDRFVHLKTGLAAVLVYVGVKMSIAEWVKIPTALSLAVIACILGAAVVASLAAPRAPDQRRSGAGEGGAAGSSIENTVPGSTAETKETVPHR
jgi:tellurite resistance protein TerC